MKRIYISSVSFEDRCRALPESLAPAQESDCFVLFDFDGYEDVAPYIFNRFEMKKAIKARGYEQVSIEANIYCPLEALKKLKAFLLVAGPSEIIFDVSTFPRNFLFGIAHFLSNLGVQTRILYYRPLTYGDQLSRGVRSIQAVPGFDGNVNPNGEVTVIFVLGYEGYKAVHAWEQIGPNRAVVLLGDPPFEREFLATSRQHNEEFLRQVEGHEEHPLHTFDPFKARRQLDRIYAGLLEESPEASVIICALGTKLQSLAVLSFVLNNPKVAIAYVSSEAYYCEDYSKGFQETPVDLNLREVVGGRL